MSNHNQDRILDKLQGLLKDNFDEASFLYDLYKTSTVTEVSQFKLHMEDTQKNMIEENMRRIMAQEQGFEDICQGVVDAKKKIGEEIDHKVEQMKMQKER